MILCIDPGLRHCGTALFNQGGRLHEAALIKVGSNIVRGPKAHRAMALEVYGTYTGIMNLTRVILEFPRIYPRAAQQKGDLNDLLDLAGVDGAIAGLFSGCEILHVFPSDWKGQVPKPIMTKRIYSKLSEAEKAVLANKDHNTLDAVGIGLHHFGRL